MDLMKAVVFRSRGVVAIEERKKPVPGTGQAVIRITTTTICGTDVHIVKGEYPVKPGLVLGHEPVGIIDSLGEGLDDEYFVGQRVVVGAITPCGQCFYCLNAVHSQCRGALGGWRFGNTIDGAWAEYPPKGPNASRQDHSRPGSETTIVLDSGKSSGTSAVAWSRCARCSSRTSPGGVKQAAPAARITMAQKWSTCSCTCLTASTLVLGPLAISGVPLLHNLVLAAALWLVVAAVAVANGGQLSWQALRSRAA